MKEEALRKLLEDMSLEEKVYQLVQYQGANYAEDAALTGALEQDHITRRGLELAGSTLCIWGADKLRRIHDACMAAQPHHIPMLFMLDVIHGHRTAFPCPLGLAATFSPEVVEEGAAVAARESAADGIHVTFAPMADLCRDARWGRCMESSGEDPFLNGQMAAAMVRGFQGADLHSPEHIAACVKHFAGYGAAEAGRDYQNVELSEHTLREYYLTGYQAAIDAGAKLVMSAYHTYNVIPCTGNRWLLKDILREELGFDGLLISDYRSVGEMVPHGYCEDYAQAAKAAMEAGVDVDMEGRSYAGNLQKLVEDGFIPMERVDEAVWRVLKLKNDLGLFEDPYHGASEERSRQVQLCPDHRAAARKAAAASAVLLKNEGILPLQPGKIAFIGPYARHQDLRSAWSFSARAEDCVSLEEGAKASPELAGWQLRFASGCTMLDNHTRLAIGGYESSSFEEENQALLREAEEAARWADTVVLCLGEHRLQSGEAASRVSLHLPEIQQKLLDRVLAWNPNTAVLVFSGRPLVLEKESRAKALLACWLPGSEGGPGIVDVLTGKVCPGGKLPMSFPRQEGQLPMSYSSYSTGRPASLTPETDYASRYLDCGNDPLYPFGYGLSYTDFTLTPVCLSSREMGKGETITAWTELTNTGEVTGTEVVQLYLQDLAGSRVRPVKALKGFRKISLAPGETARVEFAITEEMLRFYTGENQWASEPGWFRVMLGTDSRVTEGPCFLLKE